MKQIRWLSVLLLLCLLIPLLPARAADKEYYWDFLNVDITVQPNSDLVIEETHKYVFTSGSFTFAYRDISTARLTQISNVEVWEGNTQYRQGGDAANTYRISTESGSLRITWWYPTTQDASRTFRIKYTVKGALRFYQGGDQLFWKAVFPDRDFRVNSSTVTVHLPAAFTADQLVVATYGAAARWQITDQRTVVFTAQNIPSNTELEVRVQWPHGVVSGAPAAWQAAADRQLEYDSTTRPVVNIILIMAGIGIAVVGLLALFLLWYTRGRDYPAGLVAEYLAEPPSDTPPGVAGTLLDERADMQDIVATLVDLARRGVIKITETFEKGFLGIGGHRDFVFDVADMSIPLRKYEAMLVNRVFAGARQTKLSALKEKFYKDVPEISKLLYNETVEVGYFARSPEKTRQLYTVPGIMIMVATIAAAIFVQGAASRYTDTAWMPFAGLSIVSFGLMIIGKFMPKKTEEGAVQASKWRAFRQYLSKIEKYTNLEQATALFDKYLPYAIAFGLEKSWIKKFAATNTPAPGWYMPYYPAYGGSGSSGGRSMSVSGGGLSAPSLQGMSDGMASSLQSMSDGLSSLLNSTASTLSSSPSSSGGFSGGGGGAG